MNTMTKVKKNVASISLFSLLLCVLPTMSYAGSWNGWIYQSTYPTTSNLYSVKFVTPQKGWIAGEQGTILYTADGGATWENQEGDTEKTIKSLFFVDERLGWAVGGDDRMRGKGIIIHTNNGGKTWVSQKGDFNSTLNSVFFLNDKEGWIAGDQGILLHTANGGQSWERQRSASIMRAIASVYFVNSRTGWLLAGDEIYRTIDGGKNWDRTWLDIILPINMGGSSVPPDWSQGELYFINEKKGFAVIGFWHLFLTEDGGKTWTNQFPAKAMSYDLRHISFSDEKKGCATGSSIICTEDGGRTWTDRLGGSGGDVKRDDILVSLQGISFSKESKGWTVGKDGQILKTDDAGRTWIIATRYNKCGENAFFISKKIGWLHGNGTPYVCKTDDGGQSWEKKDAGFNVWGIFFLDPMKGWAVGCRKEGVKKPGGGPYPGNVWAVIKHTNDGGRTWKTQYDELVSNDLFYNGLMGVYFADNNTGWAVGYKGIILRTDNAGGNWKYQRKATDPELILNNIRFLDLKGWAVGTRITDVWTGYVFHTVDGGNNWQMLHKFTKHDAALHGILFTDAKSGWVTGVTMDEHGWLFHTTDGGKTWMQKGFADIGASYPMFLDQNRGAFAAERDWIIVTLDTGKTWRKIRKPLRKHPWHLLEILKAKSSGYSLDANGN